MRNWQTIKRPLPVTIVLWGVFLFVVGYGGQVLSIGQQLPFLLRFDNLLDPRWRLATAVFWAVLWLGMWLALRRKRPFTQIAIPILYFANLLFILLWQSLFTQPIGNRLVGLYALAFASISLFSAWALNNQGAKQYFSKGI